MTDRSEPEIPVTADPRAATLAPVSLERLSAPKVRKATSRRLSDADVVALRRVANALIPALDDHPGGGVVDGFVDLLHEALAIMDPDLDAVPGLAHGLDHVPEPELFDALRQMSHDDPDGFYVLSLLLSGVYVYAPEVEQALGYPHPHQNPIDINQIVDELSTGILEPVVERGEIFVRP